MKPEVAAGRAFHDRLATVQLKFGVETHDHGVVAIAVEPVSDVREPQLLVELGVPTAGHVEVEMIISLPHDLDVHATAACPHLLGDPP